MAEVKISRVKSDTDSNKLAGYIAYLFEGGDREHDLHCIGPASISQAAKAIASAIGMLTIKKIDVAVRPSYFITKTNEPDEESKDKTGICLTVFRL